MCSLRGPLWKKPNEDSSSQTCNSIELLSPSSHLYTISDSSFMAKGRRGRRWRFEGSLREGN